MRYTYCRQFHHALHILQAVSSWATHIAGSFIMGYTYCRQFHHGLHILQAVSSWATHIAGSFIMGYTYCRQFHHGLHMHFHMLHVGSTHVHRL